VRGESTLQAGLLVAPQGIGAMVTMPIAGALSDRIPVGRIVPVGLVLILVGMFGLTQVTSDTSYTLLIIELVVMGFGMGATMMPLFTAALKTLRPVQVARGSTLLNISQQIASSVGVAVMSVLLTNHLKGATSLADSGSAFAKTYWVAWVLVLITLVPALMLPRRQPAGAETNEVMPPVAMH
jgi:MFS family permease